MVGTNIWPLRLAGREEVVVRRHKIVAGELQVTEGE